LFETSKDLPPNGLGLTPSQTWMGKSRQFLLRKIANLLIFGEPNRLLYRLFDKHGITYSRESLFDLMIHKSDLLLQSGTPRFEYERSDLGKNIRFIGALLPYAREESNTVSCFDERLNQYSKIILVTQGTVEKD